MVWFDNNEEFYIVTMSMVVELTLLIALFVIFIVSFCGLLQKIRKSYEQERALEENSANAARARESNISFTEVYISPVFLVDEGDELSSSVLANGPPPYTEVYCGPPPQYEEVVKNHQQPVPLAQVHA